MRDGTRIAVDLHLPRDVSLQKRLPTIVRQTRYFRSVVVKSPFHKLPVARVPDLYYETRRLFLANGYAWVDVDVRGTGASFGNQPYPWALNEIKDGGDVVSWIVAKPWSNGRVGSLGISYDGTTAELLTVNQHPAVRAVAPMFSLFDVFADVAFPGGIHLEWFTRVWSRFNRTLDANQYPPAMAQALWLMFEANRTTFQSSLSNVWGGRALTWAPQVANKITEATFLKTMGRALSLVFGSVEPVEKNLLSQAIHEHSASFDIHEGARSIGSRDDKGMNKADPEATIDRLSPHSYVDAIKASGAAIYNIGGFRDGAYQHGAIKRFRTIHNKNDRLLLGPFCHAGKLYCSAAKPARPTAFDMDAELLRFFNLHLLDKDDGLGSEAKVHYYTSGEEVWKSDPLWPPAGTVTQVLSFGPERRLLFREAASQLEKVGADEYRVDPNVGTGPRSRWRGLIGHLIPADYPDRKAQGSAALVYTSHPLEKAIEITGHPTVALRLRCSTPDATVFVYLEEELADGDVRYLTEGQIRLKHRAISANPPYDSPAPTHSFEARDVMEVPSGEAISVVIGLLPISHRLGRGSSFRLAITGADCDHFVAPPFPNGSFSIEWGKGGSTLVLPISQS